MKFPIWYAKHRPYLLAMSLLWFIPLKYRLPVQRLVDVLDHAINVGGVFVENLNVRE